MKFRLKTTLCMVCLVSLLFGAGSCALISFSFQNALEREQAAARSAYALLVRTLQLVETVEVWSQPQDVVQVLQQLSAQGNKSWSALSLETEQEFLSQGSISDGFLDLREQVDETHYAQSAFSYGGKQYLQLAGQLEIQGEPLILNVAYDISSIYQTRQQQQQAHGKIFAILFVVCAGLSYSIAWFLTRPLDKLSQTAQALAAGDLSRRSGVQTQDELGALAREFDAMAARQEANFAALKATMEGQDRFIGSFTHELKTPMTSILGYADLLRRGTLSPEEQANAADYIFSEGKRLERLSLKLLELYLAEHQALSLVPAAPADRSSAGPHRPPVPRTGAAGNCPHHPMGAWAVSAGT